MKDRKVTVTLLISQLIPVTENHGGYKAVTCVGCGNSGWEGQLKHEPNCPVAEAIELTKGRDS